MARSTPKPHREELAAERQRADATLEAMRAEHRRETEALQAALTTPRPTQHEQPAPQPQQACDAYRILNTPGQAVSGVDDQARRVLGRAG
ncbi:MAG: hypothetical protein WCF33_11590 [Pseudonocardiaceae bacterium]